MTAPLPLDRQLCFSLYAASLAINRLYKPMLDRLGITYPQFLVLGALWDDDDRTVGGIAARLSLESSTVTPLVKRLEVAGFVTRTRDAHDERQVRVALTDSGRALQEECTCLADSLVERSGLSMPDIQRLNRDVQALRTALAG
ncbi:MarR family winged helix-turn-helix transcriptional regulator [Sphingomonas sp. 1P08PE]|uniref:MarR family winged helix-turn-helix transcriptional regulator n=1 Tax=Sphingomonas sp. 1P08PE TaxID=554122 RepID=UPI00399FA2F8